MALSTVGADGTLASVVIDAVLLSAVTTFAPFLAFTWKVYKVLTDSPVMVFVPQTVAVCHAALSPRVPPACKYLPVTVS